MELTRAFLVNTSVKDFIVLKGVSMEKLVFCKKLQQELPGLNFIPFDDELGQRIYQEISADAWRMWLEHSKMLINEYRLDLMSEQAFQFLHDRCEAFLFGEGSAPPSEYQPNSKESH